MIQMLEMLHLRPSDSLFFIFDARLLILLRWFDMMSHAINPVPDMNRVKLIRFENSIALWKFIGWALILAK